MSRILILANHDGGLYHFRIELVQRLVSDGHCVVVSCPKGIYTDKIIANGCDYREINIARHGMNPVKEIGLVSHYIKLIKDVKPDVVLSYTVKPNIYGGLACSFTRTPYIANITGLGTAIENGGVMQKVLCVLYKIGLKKARKIFFQNTSNEQFFANQGIYENKHIVIPGSGVNLNRHSPIEYPENQEVIKFLMVARVMKDKGIDEYISAAETIRKKYSNTEFHICGLCEPEYETKLEEIKKQGVVIYHGVVKDVRTIIKETHCTVLPSYHEGMSNALLESAACARPVIASDIPGCRETFDEGVSGFGCEVKSSQSLIDAIEKFMSLTYDEKCEMGRAGRRKVEKCFDRQIVVEAYIKEINAILNK